MTDPAPFLIANLKANKIWEDIQSWLDTVGPIANEFAGTVIFCPPSPFLAQSNWKIQSTSLKIKLGAQDLSRFEQGAYTGEVPASLLSGICQYSIIGHSERRQNLNEDDQALEKKVQNAKAANIEPIFCVQDEKTNIPQGVQIVAYEPIFAIGTGNPDTPENAKSIAKDLKGKSAYTILYGGSVTGENIAAFLEKDLIDGALVGTASLDPEEFTKIIKSANY